MSLKESLLKEMQNEAAATRKMLERIPDDKFGWKPHEKSMTMGTLAGHIAENLAWASVIIDTDDYNFETSGYKPPEVKSSKDLLKMFDEGLSKATESFKKTDDKKLLEHWIMRGNNTVYVDLPRVDALRMFLYSHTAHHRGQLSVYMRINDIPLSSVYGPTADENIM